jgi:hypothetical protein
MKTKEICVDFQLMKHFSSFRCIYSLKKFQWNAAQSLCLPFLLAQNCFSTALAWEEIQIHICGSLGAAEDYCVKGRNLV